MEKHQVDMFMMANAKYFEGHQLKQIREDLLTVDEHRWHEIISLEFKDPLTMLLVSLMGGTLGIDRFVLGDTGLGVAKLLTCGGLGIWTIVDLFLIMGMTKQKNLITLDRVL